MSKTQDNIAIGRRMEAIRGRSGNSRKQMAHLLGITPGHLRKLENGWARPSSEILLRWAEFGEDITELLTGDTPQPWPEPETKPDVPSTDDLVELHRLERLTSDTRREFERWADRMGPQRPWQLEYLLMQCDALEDYLLAVRRSRFAALRPSAQSSTERP